MPKAVVEVTASKVNTLQLISGPPPEEGAGVEADAGSGSSLGNNPRRPSAAIMDELESLI